MQASTKDTLIKISPRRFIPDSETVNVGGLNYETTFVPKEPSAVYQAISQTNLTSLSFTYSGGVLSFTAVQAIDDDIFADYDLYFSSGKFYYVNDDPVALSGDVQEWEPRLQGNSTFNQGTSNQLFGKLTISASGITIVNDDGGLNKFLTRYDNYKNRPFNSYAKIADDFRYLSEGNINTIKVGSRISINLKSVIKSLDVTATLGNSRRFYETNISDYPNINRKFDGQAIINVSGFISEIPGTIDTGDSFVSDNIRVDGSTLPRAVEYDSSVSGYVIATCNDAITDNSRDTILGITQTQTIYSGISYWSSTIEVSASAIKRYFAGIVPIFDTGFPNSYTFNSSLTIFSVDYTNNEFVVLSTVLSTDPAPSPINASFILIPPVRVFLKGSSQWSEISAYYASTSITYSNVFDVTTEATESGDTFLKIEYSAGTNLYSNEDLRFIVYNNDSEQQSDLAKKYIETVGLTVNTSQFNEAQTQSNEKSVVNIGKKGTIENLGELIQNIGFSNNGLFFVNDQTGEIGYKIINENLSGIDWTVSSTEILDKTLVPRISYRDTYSQVNTTNSNYENANNYIDGSSRSISSNYGRWFNSEDKIYTYNCSNENVDSSAEGRIDIYKNPIYFYNFRLKSDEFYLMQIGEIVKIDDVDNKLLTDEEFVDVIIVGLKKSSEVVEVTGYVFQEIP